MGTHPAGAGSLRILTMLKKTLLLFLLQALIWTGADASGFDRGLSPKDAPVFMPEKTVFCGGMFSYRNLDASDYRIAITGDLGLEAYTLKATPFLYFCFADNQAAGLKFSYRRTMLDFSGTDLELSDDLSLSLSGFNLLQHTFYASAAYRAYMPFRGSRTFALFADAGLEIGYGQSRSLSGSDDSRNGTYVTSWEYGLNVAPGVNLFLTNTTAVEMSLGLLGVSYSTKEQIRNRVYKGSSSGIGGHLSIDFLSVNIGLIFTVH